MTKQNKATQFIQFEKFWNTAVDWNIYNWIT